MRRLEQLRKIIGERMRTIGARLAAILGDGTARVRTALAPTIAAAHGRYQKLEPRERVLVQVAGALITLFIVFNFVYLPIQDGIGGVGHPGQERPPGAGQGAPLMRAQPGLRADLAPTRPPTVPAGRGFS